MLQGMQKTPCAGTHSSLHESTKKKKNFDECFFLIMKTIAHLYGCVTDVDLIIK